MKPLESFTGLPL